MWLALSCYLLVTTGYLVPTKGYLVVTCGYLIVAVDYFSLLLVTSRLVTTTVDTGHWYQMKNSVASQIKI